MMGKDKNRYGQYFTIEAIADFMVSLIRHDRSASVLEPSCGRGVFLDQLEKYGFNNISAYEIDPALNPPYPYVQYRSFVSSPLDERFDVIVGNPPYIRWKNSEIVIESDLEDSSLWKRYFNSLCDYLFIFILKSIEQLTENGELIFICPEYWMNTTHSRSLRDYMIANGSLSEIFHFKDAALFEGVTSSYVVFRYVKSVHNAGIDLYRYNQKGKPSVQELQQKSCFDFIRIPQFRQGERWVLASEEDRMLLSAFEQECSKRSDDLFSPVDMYRLGDFCDIGNGMVSGLDKAFRIKDVSGLNDGEKSHLIHVYKAKDLQPFYNISDSYYFFMKEEISENQFQIKYPSVYAQLSACRDELSKRYSYGKDLKFWEFAFPRNESLFRRQEPRIFVPCKERISHKNYFRFAFADESTFPLQDVTGILKKPDCNEDIYYILAYLNSSRVFHWLIYNGIVKGDIVEFSEAPLASIPYRPIDWDNDAEVAIHDKVVNNTKQYIATKDIGILEMIEQNINDLFHV